MSRHPAKRARGHECMSLDAILPPPFILQRRGWEAAYTLICEYEDRLDPVDRYLAGWISARGPEWLGWNDIAIGLRLYAKAVVVRT
jgi:hypothetical protein